MMRHFKVSNSTQSLNVSLTHPPHGINSGMPPLPPPTTCYVLPPGSANSSSVNDNLSNNLSSPMGLLKGMPHFDPSIPPPCLPPGMPPLPGSDNMPSNHHAVPFMPPTSLPTADMMMRRIEIPPPVAQTSSEAQTNHSLFSHMDSISHIPVVIHSHHDSNIIHQNSVPNSRTFMNSAILQGHSLNSNSLRIEKSQLPTTTSVLPISASSILHPPPQVILMEKPQVNLLSTQHNFLIRQPHENKLTMPGSVLRPFRPEVGPAVGDLTDQQQESTNNGNLVSGQRPQRPRDVVVQQNLILPPHVMSVNQLRPNLYQPPPSSSLTNSMNHQESVKRLPVPSEFLRRLGASTTSAPPQSNTTDNNASKQTPLLPIPQVNVPPPSLQVQSLSSLGGGPAQDGLVNIPPTSSMQNNEPQACSSLQGNGNIFIYFQSVPLLCLKIIFNLFNLWQIRNPPGNSHCWKLLSPQRIIPSIHNCSTLVRCSIWIILPTTVLTIRKKIKTCHHLRCWMQWETASRLPGRPGLVYRVNNSSAQKISS